MGVLAGQMMSRARRAAISLLLVSGLVLIAAGCGGTSSESDAGTSSRTTQAPGPRTYGELADAVLLVADDLNGEWTSASPTPPASCGATGWEEASARRGSPSFRLGFSSVQHNVGVFATQEMADRVFAALKTRRSQRCFSKSLLTGIPTNGGVSAVEGPRVVRDKSKRHLGQTRYLMTADSQLGPVSVHADHVRIQVGRVISVIVLVDVYHPIGEAFYDRLVRRLSARTEQAVERADA